MKLKNIKDRLKDDTLDLSLCDLEEVPVREIASVRKATNVNLSTNLLTSLPITFVTLRQIVTLDLSRNMLTELPENFGEMTQLKHLDLYANQISRLPLSLSELKNLRWLDLKENPLTQAVASVAGPCSNMKECKACARNIVTYLSNVKLVIEEERLRRLNNAAEKDVTSTKKESKKKKKKNIEKVSKSVEDKAEIQMQNEILQDNDDDTGLILSSDNSCVHKSHKALGTGLYRSITWMITCFFLFSSLFVVALVILSWQYEQQTDAFLQNMQRLSGLPLKSYHRLATDFIQHAVKSANVQIKSIIELLNGFCEMQFKNNVNSAPKEL